MTQAARPEQGEPTRSFGRSPQPSPLPRPRQRRSTTRPPIILIADDTTDTRDLYAEYFGARGFSVVTAHDGARAVQAALEQKLA